jgi:hypothetical protein
MMFEYLDKTILMSVALFDVPIGGERTHEVMEMQSAIIRCCKFIEIWFLLEQG